MSDLEQVCREAHERYEAAAAESGWQTNPASRVSWEDVPEANKAAMRAALEPIVLQLVSVQHDLELSAELVNDQEKDIESLTLRLDAIQQRLNSLYEAACEAYGGIIWEGNEKALDALGAALVQEDNIRGSTTAVDRREPTYGSETNPVLTLQDAPIQSGSAPDRSCTCHPDDNPPRPCPRKYALEECRAAAAPDNQLPDIKKLGEVTVKLKPAKKLEFEPSLYEESAPDSLGEKCYLRISDLTRCVLPKGHSGRCSPTVSERNSNNG